MGWKRINPLMLIFIMGFIAITFMVPVFSSFENNPDVTPTATSSGLTGLVLSITKLSPVFLFLIGLSIFIVAIIYLGRHYL